jgi:LacI family transcriptional regulator
MQAPNSPTALCCFYDRIAEHFIYAANSLGLEVPADLSIIGCNDDGLAATLKPELTTIHIPAFDIGFSACRALNNQLATPKGNSSVVTIPVHLVERGSVAQLDCDDPAI